MEPTVAAIFAAAAANAVMLLGGFALWLGYRTRRAERLEQREREWAQHLIAPVEARLAALTHVVNGVAVEVERVAEAQRRLASSGQPPVPAVSSARPESPRGHVPRVVTPH